MRGGQGQASRQRTTMQHFRICIRMEIRLKIDRIVSCISGPVPSSSFTIVALSLPETLKSVFLSPLVVSKKELISNLVYKLTKLSEVGGVGGR